MTWAATFVPPGTNLLEIKMKNVCFVLLAFARVFTVLTCFAYLNHEWRALFQHEPVHILAASVATLVAASLVWIPNRDLRGWTWAAVIVLVVGTTLVTLTFMA